MDQFLPVIIGLVVPWIVQHVKGYGITSKQSIIGIAILCGAFYVLYTNAVPQSIKENMYAIFAQIMTTAFLIYEFIIKNSQKRVKSTTKQEENE